MKKILIFLFFFVFMPLLAATWTWNNNTWTNGVTGQHFYGGPATYPAGVNTFTPTVTPQPTIPGSFSGASTFNSILGVSAGIHLTPDTSFTFNETMIGAGAGSMAATGVGNTFVGANIANINSNSNIESVIVGDSSGTSLIGPCFYNTFLGAHVALNATSPQQEVLIGEGAGAFCTTPADDVFIGYHAGLNLTSGDHNVVVGAAAGQTIGTGERNVDLGFGADQTSANYSDCMLLGYLAGSSVSGKSDYLEISNRWGPLIQGDFLNGAVTLKNSIYTNSVNAIGSNNLSLNSSGGKIVETASGSVSLISQSGQLDLSSSNINAAGSGLTVTNNISASTYSVGSTPTPGFTGAVTWLNALSTPEIGQYNGGILTVSTPAPNK